MGWLEVTIKIGLAHPLLVMHAPQSALVSSFPDTGNTVYLEPPDQMLPSEYQKNLGAFDRMSLRVRRECTEQEGRSAAFAEFQKLKILSDAARVFWLFFETVRECDFRENNTLAGYPVARAEEIQNNALVRTCELESSYDGTFIRSIPLSSHSAIQITESAWNEAARKLSAHEEIPVYVSFALDAAYFAQSDPIRAVVMGNAAWETALRYYLANVASKRDPAYLVASRGGNIPRLYEFVKAARGGELFYEDYGKGSDAFYDRQRKSVRQLSEPRNKLLHQGATAIPEGAAIDAVLTVLNAIDWLFPTATITSTP